MWIENHVPAGHAFGTRHDQFVASEQCGQRALATTTCFITFPPCRGVYMMAVEPYASLVNNALGSQDRIASSVLETNFVAIKIGV